MSHRSGACRNCSRRSAHGQLRAPSPGNETLYAVVRDNVETLYEAVAAGFSGAALPPFVRRELEGYLDCGLLRRGFARAGLVFTTYDADAFGRNAAEALSEVCHAILRRLHEVHEQDVRREREREAATLSTAMAGHIAELGDLAFLLRDLIDGVERDTLEALLDETKFGEIRGAALKKIETLCGTYEPKARSARVLAEFVRLLRGRGWTKRTPRAAEAHCRERRSWLLRRRPSAPRRAYRLAASSR